MPRKLDAPLRVETVPIESLSPHSRNARTHPARQLRILAGAIKRFGFTAPIVADDDGVILAGHGRW